MFCKNCGREFEAKFCPGCGTQVDAPPVYKQALGPVYVPRGDPSLNGLAIAGMVLGILSLVLCCVWFTAILGIIGLILSIIGVNSTKQDIAVAGIVTSSIRILFLLFTLAGGMALLM